MIREVSKRILFVLIKERRGVGGGTVGQIVIKYAIFLKPPKMVSKL
jgi:hypothetical protein